MFSSLTSRPAQMRSFVEGQTAEGLKRWLLKGLKDGVFAPLEFGDEYSLSEHLRSVFATASGDGQEKLKLALTLAIDEWTCEGHGPRILIVLTYFVGDIRASAALRRLQLIVETGQLRSDSPDDDEATSVIFSVLGGFAEQPEVELFLERYFFDDRWLDYRALLFGALCERSPDRYDRYVPGLLAALQARPDAFAPTVIFRNLVSIVSFYVIARRLSRLEEHYRTRLLYFLKPIFREAEEEATVDATTARIIREHLLVSDVPASTVVGGVAVDQDFVYFRIPYQDTTAEDISDQVTEVARDCHDQDDLTAFVLGAMPA